MEAASAQSAAVAAAAAKPESQYTCPPMAQPNPGRPPMAMITAELEAAIAALPAKDALREAFDRLAACSPFPLPFTWDDLDGHIFSLQSSISLRFRQLRVLEAARPAPAVSAPAATGDDQEGKNQGEEDTSEEEEEEVEVEEEEAEEEDEEVVVEVVEVEEEEEEEEEEVVEVEEEEEVVEVEEEEVDANNAGDRKEQKTDEDMQEAQEDEVKVEEQEELEANDEELKVDNERKAEEEQEEADVETGEAKEERQEAKKVSSEQYIQEEKGEAKVSPKQGDPALQGADKALVVACAGMDAARLVKIVWKNICGRQEYPVVMRYAPDAAALVLRVVRDFLLNKEPKTNKVWENCVGLIRSLPVVTPELPVHMMEQANQLAKDWKKMIDKPGSCGDLGMLASWALLYFLISYNIVSELDVDQIIRLFGTIPHKYQKKSCIELCKKLGLDSRITDLIEYLIGNGQHLGAIQITCVLNMVDKYPPLSLLEEYVENAKWTALELLSKNASHKSMNPAISKEVENLWIEHTMVKQQHPHSSQWSVIMAEINNLLAGYTNNRSLNASTASTSNAHQQQQKQKSHDEQQKHKQKNKKRKKDQ